MNHKMEYGTAYHKALEEFYSSGDKTAALNRALEHYSNPEIVVPETDWRTSGHLANCLNQYFENYAEIDGLVVDRHMGEPLLEMKFAYPFYTNGTVDVLLCGTIDFLGTYFGENIICDHTSTAVTAIDRYLNAYRMSTQLMAYTMVDILAYFLWVVEILLKYLTRLIFSVRQVLFLVVILPQLVILCG